MDQVYISQCLVRGKGQVLSNEGGQNGKMLVRRAVGAVPFPAEKKFSAGREGHRGRMNREDRRKDTVIKGAAFLFRDGIQSIVKWN